MRQLRCLFPWHATAATHPGSKITASVGTAPPQRRARASSGSPLGRNMRATRARRVAAVVCHDFARTSRSNSHVDEDVVVRVRERSSRSKAHCEMRSSSVPARGGRNKGAHTAVRRGGIPGAAICGEDRIQHAPDAPSGDRRRPCEVWIAMSHGRPDAPPEEAVDFCVAAVAGPGACNRRARTRS